MPYDLRAPRVGPADRTGPASPADRTGPASPADRSDRGRVAVLRGRLRAVGGGAYRLDATVAACAAWTSEILAEVALSLDDPRGTELLLDEASALLASARAASLWGVAGTGPCAEPLTAREAVVLRRLRSGASLREIGAQLYVSVNTVKSHTRAVYRKLGVSSRDEALRRAEELHLL